MKIPSVFIAGILFTSTLFASSDLEEAVDLLSWLEQNATKFAACEPVKKDGDYILCDQTRVSQAELKKMFTMQPSELIISLQNKGLKVELVCAAEKQSTALSKQCVKESTNKMFAEISALHGKYLPEGKTILIRNSASLGSLIHEYVHSLQSQNENPVYGKIYKKQRNELQHKLKEFMDDKISFVQELEKRGKKAEVKPHIKTFMLASEIMRGFAPWQDLIDERGIFLLYLKFGKDFGVSEADLALAKKNMGFICKNPKLSKLLPKEQCVF